MRYQLRVLALLAAVASTPAIGFAQAPSASASGQASAATTTQNPTGAQSTPGSTPQGGTVQRGAVQSDAGLRGTVQGGVVQGGTVQGGVVQGGVVQGGAVPAGQRQPGQGQAGQGGMSVSAFLAHKLRQGNQAEVDLGKLASEKAKSDSVKQFAQTMVKHHTEMIQKIDQANIGDGQGARGAEGRRPGAGEGGGAQERPGLQRLVAVIEPATQVGSNVRNSQSNTNGEERRVTPPGGTSQGSSAAGQAGGATPAGTASPAAATTANPGINPAAGQAGTVVPAQTAVQPGRQPGAQGGQGRGRGMGPRVPQQLIAVVDQAGDNELQMTKDMLQKKEGEDFDMCYIGQQIVAHTCMLAKLEAIKTSGPDDLEQLVSEAAQGTRQHLDMATKIAEELKGKK